MSDSPQLTAEHLAQLLGGRLDGDPARLVRGVAPLDAAGDDDLSWIGAAQYLPKLAESRAGVVLAPHDCEIPAGRTAIHVDDPDAALCDALAALAPPRPTIPPGVHPTAVVEEGAVVDGAGIGPNVFVGRGAVIGSGTQLHAGVYVGEATRIGRDCVLWPNTVVRERCELGNRVILHSNVTVGADGFGYLQRDGRHRKIPQIGRVVIEDDVEVGANTCIDRARSGETRIGAGSKIDNLVQIGHNVRVGESCIVVSQCGISGSTTLGTNVVLAGQIGVTDHVKIGDRVVVAAKSGVSGDIPAGKVVRGIPAVDKSDYGRQTIALRRLPKMIGQLRELEKRVRDLESAANDRA